MPKPRSLKRVPTERKTLNHALAKALAYKQAGNQEEAVRWTVTLVSLLYNVGLLPKPQTLVDLLREFKSEVKAP